MTRLTRGWRTRWPALLIVMLIILFSGALLREGRLRDLDVARLGSLEAANLISEAVTEGREADGLPRAVTGWGVYTPDGTALMAHGSAPAFLPAGDAGAGVIESVDTGRLRTVRSMVLSGIETSRSNRTPGGTGGRGMRRRILIDWNRFAEGRNDLWRLAGAVGLTALAVVLLVMQQRSAGREESQRRLVQLGMAARTLTHEIRNPLGVLKAQESLLRRILPDRFATDVNVIGEEVERLRRLTDRVRDWLADPRGHPENFDITVRLERIAARQVRPVTLELPGSAVAVRMDPMLFDSAVENLIRNAAESQGDAADGPPVQVSCRIHGRRAAIIVDDRGCGLPPGDRERLFDPFFTTKTRGSGVGLPLARQLVEAAAGRLTLENREGGGTRAVIDLPREKI